MQECRLSAGLWGADIFFLRIASDAPNVPAGIAGRWGMFILQAPQRALLCEISCAPETLLQRKDVICRSLYNDAAQGDYVQYLQYIRALEHQHRIFRIKPDIGFEFNHCGNGWSVGRLTANGLMGVCDIIPKSSAKPGDLIFFQGTYDTSGASHVGIYVGNGMMIHCGNPISYASIESNYWQQHFYCFGRIRN